MQEDQSGPMKTFGDVRTWLSDDLVGTAEIARPPDNFFDVELIASLADAYARVDGQAGARAVVVCSEGKHFCAGADFSGRSGQARPGAGGARNLYVEAVRLFEAQLPVVAAVQGAAVGGGLGLACSADFRVASPQVRVVADFAKLRLHHRLGLTVTLPPIVGPQRGLDMLLTRRPVGCGGGSTLTGIRSSASRNGGSCWRTRAGRARPGRSAGAAGRYRPPWPRW